jgi:arylsulfatase
MSQGTQMLLVAAYPDPAAAQSEFDAIAGRVRAKEITSQGMILVAKAADGKVVVADTGNHLGRKGAGWGGGVGVLVGLFAPPLLASGMAHGATG